MPGVQEQRLSRVALNKDVRTYFSGQQAHHFLNACKMQQHLSGDHCAPEEVLAVLIAKALCSFLGDLLPYLSFVSPPLEPHQPHQSS